MDEKREQLQNTMTELGLKAVLSDQMSFADGAVVGLLASAKIMIVGGMTALEAVEFLKARLTILEQNLRPSRPNKKPAGYVNITGREYGGGDGPLSGHRIVFTGSMEMPRQEAAALAAGLGAQCSDSVSMRTTLLVVGNGDGAIRNADLGRGIRVTITAPKSGKQAKAENLIAEGAAIQIMDEAEFLALCNSAEGEVE